jgi:hypothetical protein
MSLRDTLDENGIKYKNSPFDQNEITMCCLFCEDNGQTADTRFRLGVNVQRNMGHCL